MRTISLRTRIVSVLVMVCMLALLGSVLSVGSAHAAAAPRGAVVPHVDPNATITGISVNFHTHDDDKDANTAISVLVQEPVGGIFRQNIASLSNFAGSTQFGDNPPSDHSYPLTLLVANLKLSSLTNAPTFTITISPHGNDTWFFDISFTLTLSDGSVLTTTPLGEGLSQSSQTATGTFS